jgi:hypothetical protein
MVVYAVSNKDYFSWQARAKHDLTNTAIAGCITGGAISARGTLYFSCFQNRVGKRGNLLNLLNINGLIG